MKANSKMIAALAALPKARRELPKELSDLASGGFSMRGECAFLTLLNRQSHVSQLDFQDETGYECFVNSLHIEDYTSEGLLGIACEFILTVLRAWNEFSLNSGRILLGMASSDTEDYVIKFHLRREGQSWFVDDLDSYPGKILVIESSEVD